MKQLRSTLVLIVVVALVGGYIYFNERGPIAEEGATELLRTDPAAVQTIKLETPGSPALVLRQAGGNWSVQQTGTGAAAGSTSVPADPTVVKTLVDELQLVQSRDVIVADAKQLKEFGLEKPASTLEVDGTKIEFGNKPPFDTSRVYARVGGKVTLLPVSLSDTSNKPLADWRDKAVLRVKAEEATALDLTAPLVKASFSKSAEKWVLNQPVSAPADSATVDSFLSSLGTTQSTAWLEDNPKDLSKWGLQKPRATVKVGTQELRIGKQVPGGYAAQNATSAPIFTLPDTLWSQINRAPKEWRDKKVADFTIDDVSSLTVEARKTSKAFSKVEDKWQVTGGKAEEKIHNATTDLLFAAQGWMAQDFVDRPAADSTYGLQQPEVKLTIAGKKPQQLTVGRAGGKAYVRSGSGTIFVISEGELASVKSALDILFAAAKPGNASG